MDEIATAYINLRNSRGIYSPDDFDGADTVARFEAAIDQMSWGNTLELVSDYDFSRNLSINKNGLRFVRQSGTIYPTAADFDLLYVPTSDHVFTDLVIDGKKSSNVGRSAVVVTGDRNRFDKPYVFDAKNAALLFDGSERFTFTASASQTTFALDRNIGDPWNVKVLVDGVGQNPGVDYMVSGANVVFAVPRTTGQIVDCILKTLSGQRNQVNDFVIAGCDGVGISNWNTFGNRFLNGIIEDAGLENITCDIDTTSMIVSNVVMARGCRIGGVGGIGIDRSRYNYFHGLHIIGTLNALPQICIECQAGDTDHNIFSGGSIVDGTGHGVHVRRRTVIYPATTGGYGRGINNSFDNFVIKGNLGSSIHLDAQTTGTHIGAGMQIDTPVNDLASDTVFIAPHGAQAYHFDVAVGSVRSNVTGNGEEYTIPFDTAVENDLGIVNLTTGVATFPRRGSVMLTAQARLVGGSAANWIIVCIYVKNASGTIVRELRGGVNITDENILMATVSGVCWVDAGHTAYITVRAGGEGSNLLDIPADTSLTRFSGAYFN